jgi:hypothetical protein
MYDLYAKDEMKMTHVFEREPVTQLLNGGCHKIRIISCNHKIINIDQEITSDRAPSVINKDESALEL